MIVVKVGGSLYDHPRLGSGLAAFLETLPEPVLLVPGGGPFADAIRELDRIHGLGEERSHLLALEAMNLGGAFLRSLGIAAPVLDAVAFDTGDMPRTWEATSDSIAAVAARTHAASRLILLKSTTPAPGWVDPLFDTLTANAPFTVDGIDFRALLDAEA